MSARWSLVAGRKEHRRLASQTMPFVSITSLASSAANAKRCRRPVGGPRTPPPVQILRARRVIANAQSLWFDDPKGSLNALRLERANGGIKTLQYGAN